MYHLPQDISHLIKLPAVLMINVYGFSYFSVFYVHYNYQDGLHPCSVCTGSHTHLPLIFHFVSWTLTYPAFNIIYLLLYLVMRIVRYLFFKLTQPVILCAVKLQRLQSAICIKNSVSILHINTDFLQKEARPQPQAFPHMPASFLQAVCCICHTALKCPAYHYNCLPYQAVL